MSVKEKEKDLTLEQAYNFLQKEVRERKAERKGVRVCKTNGHLEKGKKGKKGEFRGGRVFNF